MGEYYVVPFTSAKMIGSISIMDTLELAKSCQKQLRANKRYKSIKIMSREEFLEAQEKEDAERRAYY